MNNIYKCVKMCVMNQLRLFFAIDLPDKIKDQLLISARQEGGDYWRWTTQENLHITMLFLGYANEQYLPQIIEAGEEACLDIEPFSLTISELTLGPLGQNISKRMIWANIKKEGRLEILKNDLADNLAKRQINFQEENKLFRPHITVARLKSDSTSHPQDNGWKINFQKEFEAKELLLMASDLGRSGPIYTPLQSYPFGLKTDKKDVII